MINGLTLTLYKLIIWLFFDNSVTYIEAHQQPIPQKTSAVKRSKVQLLSSITSCNTPTSFSSSMTPISITRNE